jgi:ATP-dependent Clp protease adaptor protein ClpS
VSVRVRPDALAGDAYAHLSDTAMIEQQDNIEGAGISENAERSPPREAATRPRRRAAVRRRPLPQFRVLLHNDDINAMPFVVRTLTTFTPLNHMRATVVMLHAHRHGVALILITHRERAELYQVQIRGRGLRVTIEPDARS